MTGKPDVLQSTGSQRVGHDWVTEQHHCAINGVLNFYKLSSINVIYSLYTFNSLNFFHMQFDSEILENKLHIIHYHTLYLEEFPSFNKDTKNPRYKE